MKKSILHIFAVIMAVYMAFIGGGVNIYQYCCETCRHYGHNVFDNVTCDIIHVNHVCSDSCCKHKEIIELKQHDHHENCAHIKAQKGQCGVLHIDAPILQQNSIESVDFTSPSVAILSHLQSDYEIQVSEILLMTHSSQNVPLICPSRAILVLKSSYLI